MSIQKLSTEDQQPESHLVLATDKNIFCLICGITMRRCSQSPISNIEDTIISSAGIAEWVVERTVIKVNFISAHSILVSKSSVPQKD